MASVNGVRRLCAAGAIVALGIGSAASGQVAQPPTAGRTQMDELLTEVRAIRADLDRAAAVSLRGQLLGMRLQLQEQRINTIVRQLSDVQQRLRENAQVRAAMMGPMKMLLSNIKDSKDLPDDKDGMQMLLRPLKEQLAGLDKIDAELKNEELILQNQLHDEQNRWSALNGQIEEMERASAGRASR
ncbi:MAG TPA: hypothetical protein VH740_18580 [Vicinamibacterales bacterium]|jgi:hypothetical protein